MPNLVVGRSDKESLFLITENRVQKIRFLINENVKIFQGTRRVALLEEGEDYEFTIDGNDIRITNVAMKGDNAAKISIIAPLSVKVRRDDYETV